MTISSTTNRVNYTGNGVTTAFAFPYKFLANADLKVYQEGTLKTITTHYTVTGAGDDAGGTVTFLVAPANLDDVVIIRDPAILQGLDLVENDNLPAESLENSFDLITMVAQRLDDRVSRAFVLNDADVSGPDLTIPPPVADEIIGWNSAGDALESKTVALLGAVSIPVSIAQGGTGSATSADARTALSVLSSAEHQTQIATRFTAGGTDDAITGTLSPAIASYTAGLRVTTTPGGANTVTGPTLNLNTLGAKTIKKRSSTGSKVALVAGDYNASGPFDLEYDGTDFILLNPVFSTMTATVGGLVPTPPNNTTTFLRGDGTFAAPASSGITLGTAVASTSGTAIDYTGLPAGTKRITVSFDGVSTNGIDAILIQLGDSGGVETSGYLSAGWSSGPGTTLASTAGFIVRQANAGHTTSGSVDITLLDSSANTWASSGVLAETLGPNNLVVSGSKSTSATLDRVRITTTGGTNTFDAGKINISYE